eukprot:scaffold37165_cov89-Cyclotella_meneghiniana.AAC.4
MNFDEILNTSSDICSSWGFNNDDDTKRLEDDQVIAEPATEGYNYDEFLSRSAADRQKQQQQQQQSSELLSAKAVTFSASTIKSNKAMPNRNQYGLYAAQSEEDDVLPPISPTYGLHTNGNSNTQHRAPSDVTSPIHNLSIGSGRDRTNTLESELTTSDGSSIGEDTASGFSKKMLIKLMKEQVNIVRDLTNAQIANKKELEEIRAEKERLELERNAAVNGGNSNAAPQQQQGSSTTQQQQLKQAYQRTHGKQSSSTKLNLPQTVQRDTSDSRSVSSKSIMDRFRNVRGPRQPPMYPRQHPDAKYYANRNRAFSGDTYGGEQSTLNNGGVSMASTILPTQIMVGQDAHPNEYVNNQQLQQQQPAPYNRDKIEITPIPERNVVPPPKKTCFTSFWWFFSHLVTLFIPNVFLCCIGRHAKYTKGMNESQKKEVRKAKNEAKQAWREKVGIFVVMLLCSAVFIGVSGVVPMFLCRETTVFTMDEIEARDRTEDWTVIFGRIYDIKEYVELGLHPGGDSILDVVGGDASKVFPRRPLGRLPDSCMNPNAELSTEVVCSEFDDVDKLVDLHCHTNIVGFAGTSRAFGKYEKGILAHRPQNLKNDVNTEWIMIYNRIYNVTSYIEGITDETTGKLDLESENAYLNEDLTTLIVNKRGEDATAVYEALYKNDVALSCLDDLFYIGIMDEPPDL